MQRAHTTLAGAPGSLCPEEDKASLAAPCQAVQGASTSSSSRPTESSACQRGRFLDPLSDQDRKRRTRRSLSEPPIIGIFPEGTWHFEAEQRRKSYYPYPADSRLSVEVGQLAEITKSARGLVDRVAQEMRAFVSARLDDMVKEHDALLKELLPRAPKEKPRHMESCSIKTASDASDAEDKGSTHRLVPSRSRSASIEEKHVETKVSPSAKSSRTDAELPGTLNQNASRLPKASLSKQDSGMSKNTPTGRKRWSKTNRPSLGGRIPLFRRQNSRSSEHSSCASAAASLKDLERDVALRLVEETFGDSAQKREAAGGRGSRGGSGERERRRSSRRDRDGAGGASSHAHETWTPPGIKKSDRGDPTGTITSLPDMQMVRVRNVSTNSAVPESVHVMSVGGSTSHLDFDPEDVRHVVRATGSGDSQDQGPMLSPIPSVGRTQRTNSSASESNLAAPNPGSPSSAPRRFSVSRFLMTLPQEIGRRLSLGSVTPIMEGSAETSGRWRGRGEDETSMAESPLGKSQSTSSLRKAHENLISRQAVEEDSEEESVHQETEVATFSCWVFLWLRVWGIFPCPSRASSSGRLSEVLLPHCNQFLMLILAFGVLLYRVWVVAFDRREMHDVNDLMLAFGSFLCIASTWSIHVCDFFDMNQGVLLRYAERWCFALNWRRQSNRHLLETTLFWLGTVACRLALSGVETWPGILSSTSYATTPMGWFDAAAFAFSAGTFFSTVFCLLHFINALVQGVDSFGRRFQRNPDCTKGVKDWNVLQAVLRQASASMEHAILVLLTTSMLMLFVCAVYVLLGRVNGTVRDSAPPFLVPTFMLAAAAGRVLVHCAEVTGRCRRVSPFVTSLSSGDDAEELSRRLSLVQYIDTTAAGFYIREVAVTAVDALRLVYLGGMAMLTIFTKAATPP